MRLFTLIALVACLHTTGCSFVVGANGVPCVSDTDCEGKRCLDGVCTDEQDCTDACGPEGSKRCDPFTPAADICSKGLDGCLAWSRLEDCGEDRHCDNTGYSCEDGCVDLCSQDSTMCDQNWVAVCVMGAYNCLVWQDQIDCDQTGQTCVDGACTGGG